MLTIPQSLNIFSDTAIANLSTNIHPTLNSGQGQTDQGKWAKAPLACHKSDKVSLSPHCTSLSIALLADSDANARDARKDEANVPDSGKKKAFRIQ
jgi:hypothetical protein